MQRGKIVCRNTVESFVNKQDWTLNGKIFEFTFEWFERFSELYNIYPVKGVLGMGLNSLFVAYRPYHMVYIIYRSKHIFTRKGSE